MAFLQIARANSADTPDGGPALLEGVKAAVIEAGSVVRTPGRGLGLIGAEWERGEYNDGKRERAHVKTPLLLKGAVSSDAQREQLDHGKADDQHCQRHGIVLEPISPVCMHLAPPFFSLD
jgi:hypothetical protein